MKKCCLLWRGLISVLPFFLFVFLLPTVGRAATCSIATDTVIDQAYVDAGSCDAINITASVSTTWIGTVDLQGAGTVTVNSGATMTMGTSSAMVLGATDDLVVNGTISQTTSSLTGIQITARNVTVTGSIDASSQGCIGGRIGGDQAAYGPDLATGVCTVSTSGFGRNNFGGGAHGGTGASGLGWSNPQNTTYGTSTAPTFLGAGGAKGNEADGGNGGGFVRLVVSGTLTVNGSISADGGVGITNGNGAGGGAGGSVYVTTATLTGSGTISAAGGNGSVNGSGGGGGRIALYYGTDGGFSFSRVTAGFGLGAGWAVGSNGTVGTTFILDRQVDDGAGTLRVTSGLDFISGGDYTRDSIIFDGGSRLSCSSPGSVDIEGISILMDNVTFACSSALTNFVVSSTNVLSMSSSTISLTGATTNALFLGGAGINSTGTTFTLSNTSFVTFAATSSWQNTSSTISVTKGGAQTTFQVPTTSEWTNFVFQGASYSSDGATRLYLPADMTLTLASSTLFTSVSSTFVALTIDGASSINASSQGCIGGLSTGDKNGFGPDTGTGVCTIATSGYGKDGRGGAAHGGTGGRGLDPGTDQATTYDSSTDPSLLGSGGGAGGNGGEDGGTGGGRVRLVVSGTLTINGSVKADGSNSASAVNGAAGGSGGSIYINAATLAGSGSITANGGNGYMYGGGGGGGRMSFTYSGLTFSGTSSTTGGVKGVQAQPESGSDGSIYVLLLNQPPSTPTALGQAGLTNGSSTGTNNPVFTFSLSDPDVADTEQYRIQIDDSADFGSPAVDYTSALGAQGTRTFQVGQAAGGGTYAVSAATLSDGSYYWRVQSIDAAAAASGYATANGGAVAFIVDTGLLQTCTFSASPSADRDFNTATNWDCGYVPGAGKTARILSGRHARLASGGPFYLSQLYVSGTLQLLDIALNVTSTFVVDTNANVTSSSGILSTSSTIIMDGASVSSTSADINFMGFVTSSGSIGSNTGNILIDGNLTMNAGTLESPPGGTLTLNGDIMMLGTSVFRHNGSSVTLSGSSSASTTLAGYPFYDLTVSKSGGVTLFSNDATTILNALTTSGNHQWNHGSSNLTVFGDTTIGANTSVSSTSGALVFGFDNATTMINAGSVSSTSGVIRFNNGTLTNDTSAYIQTNTGALTFNDAISINNGRIFVNAGMASTTNVLYFTNGSTGILDLGSGTVTSTNTFTNNGAIYGGTGLFDATADYQDAGAGAFVPQTGTFRTSGSSNRNLCLTTGANIFQNTITDGGVVTMTCNLAIAGTYTSQGVNTLNADTFVLDLGGNTTIGLSTVVTSTTGTINFTGATVDNAGKIGTLSGNLRFENVALGNTGEIHIGSGNASTTGALGVFNNNSASAYLFLEAGHVTSTVTLNNNFGNIIGGTGTLDMNGLNLNGANLVDTSGTFTALGSTLVLSGTSDITLPAYTYNNLIVSKTSNGTVTAGGTINVGGVLTITDSTKFEMNGSTLNVTGPTNIAATTAVTSTSGAMVFLGTFNSAGSVSSTSGDVMFNDLATINAGGVFHIGSGAATTTQWFTNEGTIYGDSGTFDVQAPFTGSGSFVVTPGLGLFKLSRSGDRTLTLTNANNFQNNIAAGSTVTLNSDLAIAGTYTSQEANTLNADTHAFSVVGLTTIGTTTVVTSTSGNLTFTDVNNYGSLGSNTGAITINENLTNAGTLNAPMGNLTLYRDFNNTGGVFNPNGGTLVLSGTGGTTLTLLPTVYHLTVTKFGGGSVAVANSSLAVTGDLIMSSPSMTSVFNAGTENLTVTGSTTIGEGTTVTSTSGALNFASINNNAGGFLGSSTGNINITGTLTNRGTVNASTGNLTISGDFDNAAPGVFNPDGGTLRLMGATGATVTSVPTVYNLNVYKNSGASVVLNSDMIIVGALIANDPLGMGFGVGNNLNLTSNNLTVNGLTTIGATTFVTSTSGNLYLANVTSSGTLATTLGSMRLATLTNSGTVSFGAGVATTTGALTNSSGGTINIQSANVTSTGAWTNASGATINGGTGTLDFSGEDHALTTGAGATFTAGTGRVVMSGAGDATLSGATYYNFTLGKTSGIITMASSTIIGGTLTTSGAGTLNLASKNLSVTGAFTVGTGTALRLGSGSATTTGTLTNNGTIYAETGTLSVSSTWTNAGTFDRGTGTVNLVAQAGQLIPASLTFYNLNVRTTGLAATSTGYTSVSGTFTVVTSTTFDIATYTLNAPNGYNNAGTVVVGSGGQILHPNTSYSFTSGSGGAVTSIAQGANVVFTTLQDANRNLLGGTIETVTLTAGTGSDTETLTLTETGPSTGIFRNATGLTLAGACSPTIGNGSFESNGDGFFASSYADAYDTADTSNPSKAFTVTTPSSCGGGGGGGGGGASAGSGSSGSVGLPATWSFVPLVSTSPVSSPPTPGAPVVPPIAPPIIPPIVPPVVPPVIVPPVVPPPGVHFTGAPTTIVTGQPLHFTYTYRNATHTSQSVRIVRELVDVRGRAVRTARGSATVRAGASLSRSVSERVTARAGIYTERVRILDRRGRVLGTSGFLVEVTPLRRRIR